MAVVPKLCECGCGQPTKIAPRTKASRGEFKGQPQRFLHGLAARVVRGTPEERFWRMVNKNASGCWVWTGAKTAGYGRFTSGSVQRQAHRFAYELLVGPIPDGLHLDHLCRNPACVRPDHLEPVTPGENVRRGLGGVLTTHCPQGHSYSPENTYLTRKNERQCRACKKEADERYRKRRAGADIPLRQRGRPRVAT